jgi:hypothetical protein
MRKPIFQRPIVGLILVGVCFLIALHLWRWYGPTPYRTLRLFLKALRDKNAEAIWELCGGDSFQSLLEENRVEWNAFRLPPKEKFFRFLDEFVFSQIPQRATFSWQVNPILAGRFLWFQRHSPTLFYFTVKGPNDFQMPVVIQKVFGRWVVKPRTTFGSYLEGYFRRQYKMPMEQSFLRAGYTWAQYGGAWKPGEPIGALKE